MGRKGWEEGEEGGQGPTRSRVCVWSSLGHQPQPPPPPPPPPPPFSKIAVSALPAKKGLRAAAPIPGAESRVQAPPLAKEGECQAETGSAHTSTRAHRHRARPLGFRAAPARWRGGGGRDRREFRGGSRRRGSPPGLT